MHHDHHHHDSIRRTKPDTVGEVDTASFGELYSAHAEHHPHFHPGYEFPPLRPLFVPGMSPQEQLGLVAKRVDDLTETLNRYSENVYGAYEAIVHSAICNDAYYHEIVTETGYLTDTSAKYTIVSIPFVDDANKPIILDLGLAYNNTANSGVKESIMDFSGRVIADKIIPAFNITNKWTGKARYKLAPIDTEDTGFTLGITDRGFMKIYNSTATEADMNKDGVVNAMGVQGVLISAKSKTEDNYPANKGEQIGRVAMGMDYDTQMRYIVMVDGTKPTGVENGGGCTSDQIADLLLKRGCTVAVELANGSNTVMMDKGELVNIPYDDAGIANVPKMNCFWYITKERHYHNEYVREVGELMQKYGRALWQSTVSDIAVSNLRDYCEKVEAELKQEEQDRKDADSALQNNIDSEANNRAEADKALQANIDAEADARNKADKVLQNNIDTLAQKVDTEVARLDSVDAAIRQELAQTESKLHAKDIASVEKSQDGNKDIYRVKLNDSTYIDVPVETYNYTLLVQKLADLSEVEKNLNSEIQARKDADDNLQAQITKEVTDRTNADSNLQSQITSEASTRLTADEKLQSNINNLQSSLQTLMTDYEAYVTKTDADLATKAQLLATVQSDIATVKAQMAAIQTTQSSMDTTLTEIQKTLSEMEQSLENNKQTVANLQTSWEQYKETINTSITELQEQAKNHMPITGITGEIEPVKIQYVLGDDLVGFSVDNTTSEIKKKFSFASLASLDAGGRTLSGAYNIETTARVKPIDLSSDTDMFCSEFYTHVDTTGVIADSDDDSEESKSYIDTHSGNSHNGFASISSVTYEKGEKYASLVSFLGVTPESLQANSGVGNNNIGMPEEYSSLELSNYIAKLENVSYQVSLPLSETEEQASEGYLLRSVIEGSSTGISAYLSQKSTDIARLDMSQTGTYLSDHFALQMIGNRSKIGVSDSDISLVLAGDTSKSIDISSESGIGLAFKDTDDDSNVVGSDVYLTKDALTLSHSDGTTDTEVSLSTTGVDVNGALIHNVADPVDENDAVNLKTLANAFSAAKASGSTKVALSSVNYSVFYANVSTTIKEGINKKKFGLRLSQSDSGYSAVVAFYIPELSLTIPTLPITASAIAKESIANVVFDASTTRSSVTLYAVVVSTSTPTVSFLYE